MKPPFHAARPESYDGTAATDYSYVRDCEGIEVCVVYLDDSFPAAEKIAAALNAESPLKSWPSEVTEIAADMRDHGLRFDLNPTVEWRDEESLARCYLDYIRRMDERARDLGRTLLDWIEGRRPDDQDREFAKLLSEPHKPNCSRSDADV